MLEELPRKRSQHTQHTHHTQHLSGSAGKAVERVQPGKNSLDVEELEDVGEDELEPFKEDEFESGVGVLSEINSDEDDDV
jgi:hypothetical protein